MEMGDAERESDSVSNALKHLLEPRPKKNSSPPSNASSQMKVCFCGVID